MRIADEEVGRQADYRAGAISSSSLLEAQESRRQAGLALSANRLAQLENYATLCQALGGGTDLPLTK